MTVNVNNQSKSVSKNSSLELLLQQLDLSRNGIAIAVNNEIIGKEKWNSTILNSNDTITIIQATQGG